MAAPKGCVHSGHGALAGEDPFGAQRRSPPFQPPGSAQGSGPGTAASTVCPPRTPAAPAGRSPAAQHLLWLQDPYDLRPGLGALVNEALQPALVGGVGHLAYPVSQEGRLPSHEGSILQHGVHKALSMEGC